MVHVTAFFAGLLAFLYIGLSIYVVKKRAALLLPLGDGGDASIIRRIRAHSNFAEYVPFCLLLMALDEINRVSPPLLCILGVALVTARLSHAYGLLFAEVERADNFRFRFAGVATTFFIIAILALIAIF